MVLRSAWTTWRHAIPRQCFTAGVLFGFHLNMRVKKNIIGFSASVNIMILTAQVFKN